ncbi:membrane cofactor protein-like [Sus scrofa]|uniref:membrane cofactor protein-like n=1 Tax=Sus scrofa TaxID=9823 RepID=UPI000A2B857A|nr:membrane cofactor protein-like [Sus scrofa]
MRFQGALQLTYRPGDRAQYECRLGFHPMVPALPTTSVCQDNNTWSPLQEACRRKSCPNLGDPVNGLVNYINGSRLFGSHAQYECNEGFSLIGANILHCEISGNGVAWSDLPPICERIFCGTPANITNGHFTVYKEQYEYNELVTYRCDPSDESDEYSLIGDPLLLCVGHDRWSSDPPECKVVKCNYPVIRNGAMISGYRIKYYYKAEVVFECNEGFILLGNNTIVCGANSTWEPEIPSCIEGSSATTTLSTSSVSGPPSILGTTTSVANYPGSHSTHRTTTPMPNHPDHPSPVDELEPEHFEAIDEEFIAVIVLTVLVAVAVVGACIYKFSSRRERE